MTARDPIVETEQNVIWFSSIALNLGMATRTVVDGFRRVAGLAPTRPRNVGKQQSLEPLLEQLGVRVAAQKAEGYAALVDDREFWSLVDRLHAIHRRPLFHPAPSECWMTQYSTAASQR